MTDIHIVGMGGLCSTGSCSTILTAACHAGLARIELHQIEEETEVHVARVTSMEQDLTPAVGAQRLLVSALTECMGALHNDRVGRELRLPLYLATSSTLDAPAIALTRPDGFALNWSRVYREAGGQAAGLRCLELAIKELPDAPLEIACVAGVEVQTDPDSLIKLQADGRALSEDQPWGYVPGDGAAAILIATTDACKRYGLRSLGGIRACSTTDEPAHRQNVPCTGAALSRLARSVLAQLPTNERVDAIYCDLNGERRRADEWGFTAPRISAFCRDVSRVDAPAQCWGDLGSAISLMLVQLTAAAFSRGDAPPQLALVWAASEDGLRGATLLQNTNDERIAWPMPAEVRPIKEVAHDRAILADLLGEAGFLVEQRFHYQELSEVEPASETYGPALERLEHRLESQIYGLISGTALAQHVCSDAGAEPGETYAAVRVFLASSTPERLAAFLTRNDEPPDEQRRAMASALAHGASHATQRHVDLINAWNPALALQLAADSGLAPSSSWRVLSHLGPEKLGRVFPFAIASLGRDVSTALIEPWLESEDPALKELAGLALARVSVDEARSYLWQRRENPAFARPLIASSRPGQLASMEDIVMSIKDPEARCRAWGLLGTSRAVDGLLRMLETVPNAAGEALHLISGAPLFEEQAVEKVTDEASLTHVEQLARRNGDADVGVERSRMRRFAADPSSWKTACSQLFRNHGGDERYRLGFPLSVTSILKAVTHSNLAPSTRSVCIDELAIGFGVRLRPRSDPRVRERRHDVASAMS